MLMAVTVALADGRFSTCRSFQRSALFSETGDFSEEAEAEAGWFRLAHQPTPQNPPDSSQPWDCRCALCPAFDMSFGAQTQVLRLVQHCTKILNFETRSH